MMKGWWNFPSVFGLFFMFMIALFSPSSSVSATGRNLLQAKKSTGRNLLQAKKSCSVSFEFLNYTEVTSRCRGPNYLPEECCPTFKDFACPYAELLNDVSNDCATTMFSYLNLYGKYPPGLFANVCKEDKNGLSCPPISSADALIHHHPLLMLLLFITGGLLVLLNQSV